MAGIRFLKQDHTSSIHEWWKARRRTGYSNGQN